MNEEKPDSYKSCLCFDSASTPMQMAENMKAMTNACIRDGYTITKLDNSVTLRTSEDGKIDNRLRNKVIFHFQKISTPPR